MISALVINSWKLKIFKEILDREGYKYTEHKGMTKDTLTLRVESESIAELVPFVKEANNKARLSKLN